MKAAENQTCVLFRRVLYPCLHYIYPHLFRGPSWWSSLGSHQAIVYRVLVFRGPSWWSSPGSHQAIVYRVLVFRGPSWWSSPGSHQAIVYRVLVIRGPSWWSSPGSHQAIVYRVLVFRGPSWWSGPGSHQAIVYRVLVFRGPSWWSRPGSHQAIVYRVVVFRGPSWWYHSWFSSGDSVSGTGIPRAFLVIHSWFSSGNSVSGTGTPRAFLVIQSWFWSGYSLSGTGIPRLFVCHSLICVAAADISSVILVTAFFLDVNRQIVVMTRAYTSWQCSVRLSETSNPAKQFPKQWTANRSNCQYYDEIPFQLFQIVIIACGHRRTVTLCGRGLSTPFV